MSWVAVAIGGGALIGAAGSYYSSKSESRSADKQMQIAAEAGDRATAAQLEMFYKAIELDKPFRGQQLERGKHAIFAQDQLIGEAGKLEQRAYSPETDPIYKFQERQMERGLAKRGLQRSGVAIDKLASLGASEAMRREYMLGQRRNIFAGLSGIQAGQSQTAPLAAQTGASLANIYQTQGQGLQQAAYRRGQAQAGMYEGIGEAATSGIAMYGAAKKDPWWSLR
jgi:hypothetical protein